MPHLWGLLVRHNLVINDMMDISCAAPLGGHQQNTLSLAETCCHLGTLGTS